MARFLISPGVITREVDNSQYAATVPAGNVAALVGYAEKGPFEPTLVSGPQEFNETFGKTLEDSPYLAQAAYKYFEQADQLLVVRAGDEKDPDVYPNSAQYASKSIRIDPEATIATAGLQSFSATASIAGGSYAPNATYGFRVDVDYRGFASTKYLEKWVGLSAETASSAGGAVPYLNDDMIVVKFAMSSSSATSFKINYKRLHSVGSTTDEYSADDGTRTGSAFGDTMSVTVRQYRAGSIYADVAADYVTFNGTYGAAILGSTDVDSGVTFAGETFDITLSALYTITPDSAVYASVDAVVTELNAQFVAEGIDSEVSAFKLTPTTGVSYVGIKHIGGGASGFTLTAGGTDALTMLGIDAGIYADNEAIVGTFVSSTGSATSDGDFIFKFDSSIAASETFEETINVDVTAPAANDWTLSDINSQIDAELDIAFDGTHTDGTDFWGNDLAYSYVASRGTSVIVNTKITITATLVSGTQGESIVRITAGSGNSLIDLLSGVDTSVDGSLASSVGESLIVLQAAEKGSFGNNLIFRVEEESVQITAIDSEIRYNLYVLWNGKEVSIYRRLEADDWTDITRTNYIPTLLAEDPYLIIEAEDEDGNSTMGILPSGDWLLGTTDLPDGVLAADAEVDAFNVGTNGWTEDQNGVITSLSADLINALDKIYNPEVWDFNLVAAPSDATPGVQNAIQSLCDSRRDCFGIVDAAPFGIGLGVSAGTNHVSEVTDASSTLNSSYVGAYWPWLQDYDADNQQYVWLPPSIYALKQMVYTDAVADPWFAPAGTRRGKIVAIDVEYSPSKLDRDLLYGNLNIVNPIVKFVNEGIVIWGQKTAQRSLSALNRINVRRLLIYAEKLIARMARGFLFEPHDEANWAAFSRQANAILEPIRQRRGLTTYQVICDSTTNTAALIDQNIMAGKIFLQPTKTIEFIEVEFTINAAGEVEITE